jgi:hypothetical protein
MQPLILHYPCEHFIRELTEAGKTSEFINWKTNDQHVIDWFSLHLNRLWGLNVDISHISSNPLYEHFLTKLFQKAADSLYSSFILPHFENGYVYDCKLSIDPTRQFLILTIS